MSREQIEEMAKDIDEFCKKELYAEFNDDILARFAEALYTAGYRKQSEGEWVVVDSDIGYVESECSLCKHKVLSYTNTAYRYCPNCGAKMKGDKE